MSNNYNNISNGVSLKLYNSNTNVINTLFENNSGKEVSGAAIYAINSNIDIKNCEFNSNSIEGLKGNGGAISLDNTIAKVSNSIFFNNSCVGQNQNGGALRIYDGSVEITNNLFLGNYTYVFGGAIFYQEHAKLNVNSNIFVRNSSRYNGGAIYLYSDISDQEYVKISTNIFLENSSDISNSTKGGAIYSVEEDKMSYKILNNDFYDNKAASYTNTNFNSISDSNLNIDPKLEKMDFYIPKNGFWNLSSTSSLYGRGENGINIGLSEPNNIGVR
jgi:predicted outer membrane repeat protein